MAEDKGFFAPLRKLSNTWQAVVVFVVFLGTGVGNYMVSQYRHDQHDARISSISNRVEKLEAVNYELLLQQLDEMKEINDELKTKFDKTNERIDKVLELLVSK